MQGGGWGWVVSFALFENLWQMNEDMKEECRTVMLRVCRAWLQPCTRFVLPPATQFAGSIMGVADHPLLPTYTLIHSLTPDSVT